MVARSRTLGAGHRNARRVGIRVAGLSATLAVGLVPGAFACGSTGTTATDHQDASTADVVDGGQLGSHCASAGGTCLTDLAQCEQQLSESLQDCPQALVCCIRRAEDASSPVDGSVEANESGPNKPGLSCMDAGGSCILGGGNCALVAPSSDQDCNPNNNPSGAFCCLETD